MTMPPGTPPRTTEQPARAVESAECHLAALYKVNPDSIDTSEQFVVWQIALIEQRDAAIRAAERAPLEARIAELEIDILHLLAVATGGLADAAIVSAQTTITAEHLHAAIHKLADYARELRTERGTADARAQRAEERLQTVALEREQYGVALEQIATTTVGGGGDRIAQQLRDIASRALATHRTATGGQAE